MRFQNLDCRLTAGEICVTANVANKESAFGGRSSRHSAVTRFACSPSPYPRLTNLKTCVCVLINFTYESVKYFNFLSSCAVRIFDGFVYDYFLDESVKHLSG